MSRTSRAGAVLLITAVACGLASVAAPDRLDHLATPAHELSPAATKRSQAMLSVIYHSLVAGGVVPRDPSLNPALQMIALNKAAEILRDDDSVLGGLRRQQAIVRMAAAGLQDIAFRSALQILGADLQKLDKVVHDNPDAKDERLFKLLEAAAPAAPIAGCETRYKYSGISKQGGGGTLAVTTFEVKRPLSELIPIMDPQNWDLDSARCGDYFVAAYLAKKTDDTYLPDPNGDVAEKLAAPIGTDWQDVLFEHYAFTSSNGSSWFKNLLDVTTDRIPDRMPPNSPPPPSEYRAEYNLHTSVRSQIGNDVRSGGVDWDKGHALAIAPTSGPWVAVEATKELVLSARPGASPPIDQAKLNSVAAVYLIAMGEAIAREACCPFQILSPPVLLQ